MRVAVAWLTACAYMALTWVLSSSPRAIDLGPIEFGDKVLHVTEYAVLGLLLARALRRSFPALRGWRFYAAAVLPAAGWGYLDELHQAFVPGRVSSIGDALADLSGAVLGVGIFLLLERLGARLVSRR